MPPWISSRPSARACRSAIADQSMPTTVFPGPALDQAVAVPSPQPTSTMRCGPLRAARIAASIPACRCARSGPELTVIAGFS